ncbi:MAG: aryl-sulfate sulfotransferase [Lewinella sp.]|nr:aryl-sulfate sulfotransferase [Lewinella sp.]
MRRLTFALLACGLLTTLTAQPTIGLFQNDSLAYDGYTLFAPSASRTTYLIDNCGYLVNSWTSQYLPGNSAYLVPGGRLLRTARIASNFNGGGSGGRIELFDWEGELLWSYNYSSLAYHQHHDIAYLPNGHVLILAWRRHTEAEALQAGRNPALLSGALWSETVVEVEMIGTDEANIIWEWDLWDHLVQDFDETKDNYGDVAASPGRMDLNFTPSGGGNPADWAHFNSVAYNEELDQIVLSSRHFDEIYIIDHSTTTAEAATGSGGQSGRGGDFLYRWGNPQAYRMGTPADKQLFGQHDAEWIPAGLAGAGQILVFNNGANRPGQPFSTVDSWQPPLNELGTYDRSPDQPFGPAAMSWTYQGDPVESFFSSRVSGAQRLPNGNTLVCAGTGGHLFEVTPEDEIVWEYIIPIAGNAPATQGDVLQTNDAFRATRFAADSPELLGMPLVSGEPIELEPLDYDCTLFGQPTSTHEPGDWSVSISPNPCREELRLEWPDAARYQLEVIDARGQVFVRRQEVAGQVILSTQQWPAGLYIARIRRAGEPAMTTHKFLKL